MPGQVAIGDPYGLPLHPTPLHPWRPPETQWRKGVGARLRLYVQDTGIGIKEEDIPRLFEEFKQLDASPTREYGGTGLGLAICKKIVELMGGAIQVKSVQGTGTTMTVTLPVEMKTSADEAKPLAPAKAVANNQPAPGQTYLQLAATSQHEADIMVDVLRKKSFKAMAVEIEEKPGTFRVLVGPVTDTTANKMRADLQGAGLSARDIVAIKAGISRYASERASEQYPASSEAAKFNLQYVVAYSFVNGAPAFPPPP